MILNRMDEYIRESLDEALGAYFYQREHSILRTVNT